MTHWQFVALSYALLVVLIIYDILLPYLALNRQKRQLRARTARERAQTRKQDSPAPEKANPNGATL
jgi:heme exporter protein D